MKMRRESEIVETSITFDEIPKALPKLTIPEPIQKVIKDHYTYIKKLKEINVLPDEEYEVFVQGFKEISGVFFKNGMDSIWNSLVRLNKIEGADIKFDKFNVIERAQKLAYILLYIGNYTQYVRKMSAKICEHIKYEEEMIEQIKSLKGVYNKLYPKNFDDPRIYFGHECPEKKFMEVLESEQKRLEDEIVKHKQSIENVEKFMPTTRQSKVTGKATVYIKILSHAFRALYGNHPYKNPYESYVKKFVDVIFPTEGRNVNSAVSNYKNMTDHQKMPYENLLFSPESGGIPPVICK